MEQRHPISPWLVLGLVVALHADWHLARPRGVRLSLGWSHHWLACTAVFALTAWYVHRRWPDRIESATVWNIGLGILGAQLIEPVLEFIGQHGTLGYQVEPARWAALGLCLLAGAIAYALTLIILRRQR